MELGKSIVAYKNVTVNEPFSKGISPHQPIMPGVLIIEALAQAAGVLGFRARKSLKMVISITSSEQMMFGSGVPLCLEISSSSR